MANKFFPVSIDLNNKNVLVVGAGAIAYSKVIKMISYGAKIKVLTTEIEEDKFYVLDNEKIISLIITKNDKNFDEKLLENTFLVIMATDNKEFNKKISDICIQKNILVNNITSKNDMNLRFSSIYENNECQISVSAYGNPKKSVEIKEKIKNFIEKENKI